MRGFASKKPRLLQNQLDVQESRNVVDNAKGIIEIQHHKFVLQMWEDDHCNEEEVLNRWTEKISPDLSEAMLEWYSVCEKCHDPGYHGIEILSEIYVVEMSLQLWLKVVE